MVNNFDPEADLVAANPVPEAPAAAMLPPDVNEMVLRQITESPQARWPLRGVNLARAGFLGALASVALVLLGLHLYAGSDADTITPATEVVPVGVSETTAEVLTVGPSTTLAAPPSSQQAATSTTQQAATSTTVRPATSTTLGASASSQPQIVAPAPLPDPQSGSADEAEQEDGPCTAKGPTQKKAVAAYREACSVPRVDCDPVEDHWVCSSEQIGKASP
jgi:hypothetical protein